MSLLINKVKMNQHKEAIDLNKSMQNRRQFKYKNVGSSFVNYSNRDIETIKKLHILFCKRRLRILTTNNENPSHKTLKKLLFFSSFLFFIRMRRVYQYLQYQLYIRFTNIRLSELRLVSFVQMDRFIKASMKIECLIKRNNEKVIRIISKSILFPSNRKSMIKSRLDSKSLKIQSAKKSFSKILKNLKLKTDTKDEERKEERDSIWKVNAKAKRQQLIRSAITEINLFPIKEEKETESVEGYRERKESGSTKKLFFSLLLDERRREKDNRNTFDNTKHLDISSNRIQQLKENILDFKLTETENKPQNNKLNSIEDEIIAKAGFYRNLSPPRKKHINFKALTSKDNCLDLGSINNLSQNSCIHFDENNYDYRRVKSMNDKRTTVIDRLIYSFRNTPLSFNRTENDNKAREFKSLKNGVSILHKLMKRRVWNSSLTILVSENNHKDNFKG